MRKVLISALVLILLAGFAMMLISGLEIANIKVGHSIRSIIEKNRELDEDIGGLNAKIAKEYETAKRNLDSSFKKLQSEKRNYQKTIAYTLDEELAQANQTEEYKLDYLWTNIGVYATKNGLAMKADLSHGTSGVNNQYNISITAVGEYLPISEFVYAIEKDETLGFRIEEFALVPYSEDYLQATFIIKNVAIDPKSLSGSSSGVSTGTVTDNTDGQEGPVRQIGGVTVMSDYNNTNSGNSNNSNTNTNTNTSGNSNTNTGN